MALIHIIHILRTSLRVNFKTIQVKQYLISIEHRRDLLGTSQDSVLEAAKKMVNFNLSQYKSRTSVCHATILLPIAGW